MTFLPRLTLLTTLLAGTSLHAEPMFFTPCSDTAAPGSLCSGLNVPGSYDAQGRAVGEADAMHVFVRFDLPIVRLPVPHLTAIRGLHRGVYDLIGQAFVATIGRPPRPARPFVLAATSNRK